MNEKSITRFDYSEELKTEMVELVFYGNHSKEEVVKKYGLPNVYMLNNWITTYKKKFETGAVSLAIMKKPKTNDATELKKRIKDLEKALEKANVMIYGLNKMIDYAEEELKVPVRKKAGTKQ